MARARQTALRALELDNTMSQAYGVLGTVQFSWDYDHAAAEKSFQRALELNPSDARVHMWYAVALAPQHRLDESLHQARLARELDPLSFATSNHLAAMTYFTRRYDEAMQLARDTLALDSRIGAPHAILGMGYETQQRFDDAIAEYQLGLQLAPNHGFMTGRLGHALAMAKRTNEVRELLLKIEPQLKSESFSDLYTAYIYLGLRDWDSVFRHLDRAHQRHDPDLPFISVDPIFDPVRSDPRFIAMIKKLGLAQQ
jgi:tetratricopeptide (TPR) repeat protein